MVKIFSVPVFWFRNDATNRFHQNLNNRVIKMGLYHLTILLPLVSSLARAQAGVVTTKAILARRRGVRNLQSVLFDDPADATTTDVTETTTPDDTISAPIYTPEECNRWIDTLISSDGNGSSGLSDKEYYTFLSSIEDPPYAGEYFQSFQGFNQLPWVFRVAHISLACHCEKLGMGDDCCEGDKAEIPLLGLLEGSNSDTTERGVKEEYKDLFCQQMSHLLTKSVPSPAPTAGPSVSPTKSPSSGPTSSPSASEKPSVTVVPSAAPVTSSPTKSSSEKPYVTAVSTDPQPTAAPKAPEPTDTPSLSIIPTAPSAIDPSKFLATEKEEEENKGMGIGGIIGLVLAILFLIIGVIALVVYQRRILEEEQLRKFAGEQAPLDDLEAPTAVEAWSEQAPAPQAAPEVESSGQEPEEDDEGSVSSLWSESSVGETTMGELCEDDENLGATTGSALAAMGAASTVAVRMSQLS